MSSTTSASLSRFLDRYRYLTCVRSAPSPGLSWARLTFAGQPDDGDLFGTARRYRRVRVKLPRVSTSGVPVGSPMTTAQAQDANATDAAGQSVTSDNGCVPSAARCATTVQVVDASTSTCDATVPFSSADANRGACYARDLAESVRRTRTVLASLVHVQERVMPTSQVQPQVQNERHLGLLQELCNLHRSAYPVANDHRSWRPVQRVGGVSRTMTNVESRRGHTPI